MNNLIPLHVDRAGTGFLFGAGHSHYQHLSDVASEECRQEAEVLSTGF